MASSQHRCVFVGNIPYDASEEQLIEICKEVGPVVSFRLVIDRETGKPKGYGFCEYKDEETALSARRNLQGYEINGRQLRVDFAENDKGVDRNRDQGRGGPGLAPNNEPSKQIGGPATYGEAVPHQPIGLHSAITAAAVVTGALGGTQAGLNISQNGLQNQSALVNDPLTLHLAKMSRSQLIEIMSDLKMMGTQNKELARQLLLGRPQLAKALFQAQIMLGMVTPQVLQMPNIRQAPVTSQPPFQDGAQNQPAALPGLPPIAQTRMQSGFLPQLHQGQASAPSQIAVGHSQFPVPPQLSMQPRVQHSPHSNNQVLQSTLPGQSGAPVPSIQPHSTTNMVFRPQLQMTPSSSLNLQMQPALLLQHQVPIGGANLGQNTKMLFPNANVQAAVLSRPQSSDAGYQPAPSISAGIPETICKEADRSSQATDDATWFLRNNTNTNMSMNIADKTSTLRNSTEPFGRPSKIAKLDDGKSTTFPVGGPNTSNATGTRPSQVSGPANPVPRAEEVQYSDNQNSQPQLPPDVESVLLQQVMNLTPEQLSSLPPEQQQQVIQLQQMLRRDQVHPS